MTKLQIAVLAGAAALFFALYFGCETKSKDQKTLEKTRVFAAESTDINVLLSAAKQSLAPAAAGEVAAIEQELNLTKGDTSAHVEVLKRLSGVWYRLGDAGISGYYAQLVAEQANTEDAWSKAGTTYAICVQRSQEDKVRDFCTQRAVAAFESAASINPDNLAHRINLAVVYAENPPKEDVMRGITMLLELNRNHPDNVSILNNLGRLAIKTGQFERALERLGRVLELDPGNPVATCLMADAWKGAGDAAKAGEFEQACRQLRE